MSSIVPIVAQTNMENKMSFTYIVTEECLDCLGSTWRHVDINTKVQCDVCYGSGIVETTASNYDDIFLCAEDYPNAIQITSDKFVSTIRNKIVSPLRKEDKIIDF